MLALWCALLCGSFEAEAARLFDRHTTLSAKKELQGEGSAAGAPESLYSEMQMDFESFDLNDKSGRPLMATHTDQLVKMRRLPKDATAAADLQERLEITYERMRTESRVAVPGMANLFASKSDLGVFLANKPIVIRGDGKTPKRVEGLERIRAQSQTEVGDFATRNALAMLLDEKILLQAGGALGHDSSCLGGFSGRKPGAKWSFGREEQGVKLDYDCEFEGWAEHKGKKVAVLKVVSKKAKQTRRQPNGVPAMAETEGSGVVYFEPVSREALMRMETKIHVEPMDEELRRLRAQGAEIPRNRSVMRMWNHLYPI